MLSILNFSQSADVFQIFRKFKYWNADNNILNVTYVEERQKVDTEEFDGLLPYEFHRDLFNEILKLFVFDLSKYTITSEVVQRVTDISRIIFGNRTEIEIGLVSNFLSNVPCKYLKKRVYLHFQVHLYGPAFQGKTTDNTQKQQSK